jgi:UDP-N-acetylmuramate--alanine ligase
MTPIRKHIVSQPLFGKTQHIHMVGIGGIGMSGIAEILLHRGFKVSGSDGMASETTKRLEEIGARVFIGHKAEHIEGADVVVYTSAVKAEDNVETATALEKGVTCIKRAVMLAEIMRMKYGIGIAGTHGKTTTTTMTGLVVQEGDFDPTIIVGGKVHSFDKTNAVVGQGDIVVVEADEFDRTFLRLSPSLAVITNVDLDHTDIYDDLDDIKEAFIDFANKVPFYGSVILCLDDTHARSIIPQIKRRLVTYGTSPQALLRATNIQSDGFYTDFEVSYERKKLGSVHLKAAGMHNVMNALAAIAVGLELEMSFEKISSGLARYEGVFRRFQLKAENKGIMVIDDYAHHPTEVQATLKAARNGFSEKRIIAVFQPHLYSRTQELFEEFGSSFFDADELVLTDIYPSREKPIEGVTGALIADTAKQFGHRNVHYVQDKNALPAFLNELCKDGDMVITMGAGDVYFYGEQYAKLLNDGGSND